MKKRSTKRSLIMSGLSLVMCVSMLIGSTYAWFTDSVTSSGNVIKSGTLDVDLVDEDDNSLSGEIIEFVAADGRAQDEILWEPGCTYNTEPVYLVNKGSLALKYGIVINGILGDAKLLEVIDWTVTVNGVETALADLKGELLPGARTEAIILSGHMREEAGNEYQDKTVDGISIAVSATQFTYEEDSFDDQYDADADRDSNITVASKMELQEALDSAKDGDVITLDNTVSVDESLVYRTDADIILDLGGNGLEGNLETLLEVNAGNIVIRNGYIKNVKDNATTTLVSVLLSGDAVAEIKDISIETTGTGILLEDNAKITELNANINSYVNANGTCAADAIRLADGNARIDLISGGEYVSTYSDEFIDAYSGSFSGLAIYPININSANASIGEISGGTFLGRADDGRNGATIFVNAGKIEKISGGYFGFCKYTLRNNPYFLITVNTANGASIDSITGGSFEYASGFGCDFENIVSQSGGRVEVRGEKATVSVKFSTSVKTKEVGIWDVVS